MWATRILKSRVELDHYCIVIIATVGVYLRMKISVITDISVFRFYGYIGDISADILENFFFRLKIIKNLWKYKENLIII